MDPSAAYAELLKRSREESLLASCADLLEWDEETYLPRRGVVHRANQLALLAGLEHDRATDPYKGDLLGELEASVLVQDAVSPSAVNIREWRRQYDRALHLPRHLVEEIARITTLAQEEWALARRYSDFSRFRPWLERIVTLKRSEAGCLRYTGDPYEALLDEYEPGAKSQEIARLFTALRAELVPLVARINDSRRKPNTAFLHQEYPLDRQQAFGESVAAAIGFDFHSGRLDSAIHPFTIGLGPGDCRITTRYALHDFSEGFFTILHEVGHGLYEQGLDPKHHGTPMGEATSAGIHEAQARLWENLVGRGRAFWDHFFPLARRMFPANLKDVQVDEFHFAISHVQPSFTRVQADEVTYNLHILARFELERALIAGDLKAADMPVAWNEAYRRFLGVCPPNDALGCLQDGHWSAGQIGYFPTYTLGNIFAAQLFAKAVEELNAVEEAFSNGDFTGLLGWLRENVHRQGSRYSAARLIEHATGSPLDHQPLMHGLRRKYGQLYLV
jgi:carboxypeptidase Taq